MLRVVWIFTVFAADRSLPMLYISYPISWLVTAAAHIVMFAVIFRKCRRRAAAAQKAVEEGILTDESVIIPETAGEAAVTAEENIGK